jgi:formylglycine-generating enzyme required for sulfatase activity
MLRRQCLLFILLVASFAALAALGNSSVVGANITINTVPVGNPGNPADFGCSNRDHPGGCGAVDHSFRMGTTEVTNAHYAAMLNAVATASDPYGLYTGYSDLYAGFTGIIRSGVLGSYTYAVAPPALNGAYAFDNKPVVFVSSADAMRFANWLNNGQPTGAEGPGTTETGAYTLNGATTNAALALVTRNVGARWWLPNFDEWYKAAYYDPATGSYFRFPTRTNSPPNNNPPSQDTGNSANFYDTRGCSTGYCDYPQQYPLTDVGAYTLSIGPYGTFDQGGNVEEWNETLHYGNRGVVGGSWSTNFSGLVATIGTSRYPLYAEDDLGFRVASVPEPGTAALAVVACGTILSWWRVYITVSRKHSDIDSAIGTPYALRAQRQITRAPNPLKTVPVAQGGVRERTLCAVWDALSVHHPVPTARLDWCRIVTSTVNR